MKLTLYSLLRERADDEVARRVDATGLRGAVTVTPGAVVRHRAPGARLAADRATRTVGPRPAPAEPPRPGPRRRARRPVCRCGGASGADPHPAAPRPHRRTERLPRPTGSRRRLGGATAGARGPGPAEPGPDPVARPRATTRRRRIAVPRLHPRQEGCVLRVVRTSGGDGSRPSRRSGLGVDARRRRPIRRDHGVPAVRHLLREGHGRGRGTYCRRARSRAGGARALPRPVHRRPGAAVRRAHRPGGSGRCPDSTT